STSTSRTRGTRIWSLIRSWWTTGRVLSSGRRLGLKGSSPNYADPSFRYDKSRTQRLRSSSSCDSVEPPRTAVREVRGGSAPAWQAAIVAPASTTSSPGAGRARGSLLPRSPSGRRQLAEACEQLAERERRLAAAP